MAVIVETWAAEDLEYGVEATTKTHPSGGILNCTQVSLSSFSTCGPSGYAPAKLWAPGTISAGAQVTTTIDVAGATPGDKVLVALTSLNVDPLILSAYVSEANVVTVILANLTGASVTVASGTLSAVVFHHRVEVPGR